VHYTSTASTHKLDDNLTYKLRLQLLLEHVLLNKHGNQTDYTVYYLRHLRLPPAAYSLMVFI